MLVDKLNEYRLKNKITQKGLAVKLDVSYLTIWRWLNKKVEPRPIQEYAIRKLLEQ